MRGGGLVLALLLLPAAASAQPAQPAQPSEDLARGWRPISVFAADVRVAFPTYPQDRPTADRLGVTQANLPGRGLGIVLGAHVYPVRSRRVTLGLGGEVLRSRGTGSLEPDEDDENAPAGPTVRTRFSAVSPQMSLNFGSRRGWSYVSGGLGWARFSIEREDAITPSTEDAPRRRTLNYGGGARWFMREHLAFSLDLRFYSVSAQAATLEHPDMPKMRRVVLSGGVSFR